MVPAPTSSTWFRIGSVRSAIMGNAERAPTIDELERMKDLVERGMDAGAWGVSTGLIYVPGRYATTAELIELAKVAKRYGGIYASHIRNEGARLLRVGRRGDRDRQGGGHPGPHLAPEGQRQGVLGNGRPCARSDRRGAQGRSARHGRPVSLHRLEHQARGDGGAALGHSGQRRGVRSAGRRPAAGTGAAARDRAAPRRA